MEPVVHVVNGDSLAQTLELADLAGEIRVWADALDRGPVLPVDDAEHYRVRGAYWAAATGGDADAHAARIAEFDRGLDEAAARCEEMTLWFEHDVFDQLALVRILARLARKGLPAQLTMVSIDRHPEVPHFVGMGQLASDQLAPLWPRRVPLSRDAIEEACAAWVALTANDPRGLSFLAKRVKALPFLAGALERHLEEFPDPTSGMTRTERQLLAAIARREADRSAIQANDPRYSITDVVWDAAKHALAAAGLIAGDEITSLGRQALAGAIDRVHERGIDDWRGGVRLAGKGPVWRWESRERRLVEK